jgi:hypothetical protein
VHQSQCFRVLDTILVKFYDKCFSKYRDICTTDSSAGKTSSVVSSVWAQDEEMRSLLGKNTYLLDAEEFDSGLNQELGSQETKKQIKLNQERSFHRSDLIFDNRKLDMLSNFRTSLVLIILVALRS